MTHPSSLVLESFVVGEPLSAAHAAHVEICATCAAFVGELRGVVANGPSADDASAAVAKALESGSDDRVVRLPEAREANDRAGADAAATRETRRRTWMLVTSVITPLAAAAAIVLLARGTPLDGPMPAPQAPVTETPAAPEAPAAPTAPAAPAAPDTQFKGGMQIAVVRDRGGRQERFSSTVRVRAGDRLRVEVALDQERAILGAVLADDGSYIELMPLGTRGPGTHFSERSAKIDATETHGTIIIGSPEAVARARATRQLSGVGTLRVEWEQP